MGRLLSALVCNGLLVALSHEVSEAVGTSMRRLGNAECEALWTTQLTRHGFQNRQFIGAGANGCVFKASYTLMKAGATDVAVKLPKKHLTGSFLSWKRECSDMQALRFQQCKKDKHLLDLGEAFSPNCLEVGETSSGLPFMVQHLAPINPIGSVQKGDAQFDVKNEMAVFAQLVAAVYSLHGIDRAHNDLHQENIVLDSLQDPVDGVSPPGLALIDFGDVTTLAEANKNGYKRDGNAIWRWGAVLAKCDADAQWEENGRGMDPKLMEKAKPKFLACLQTNWNTDSDFNNALSRIVDGDVAQSTEQHVEGLYETEFMKQNLPELKRLYPWDETDGCENWDEATWTAKLDKVAWETHFKCETVPTYAANPNLACGTNSGTDADVSKRGACFSLRGWGVPWACGGGLNPKAPCVTSGLPPPDQANFYDGACLFAGHPGYKFAMDASVLREITSTVTTTATTTITTSTSTTSTTLKAVVATDDDVFWACVIGGISVIMAIVVLIYIMSCCGHRRGRPSVRSMDGPASFNAAGVVEPVVEMENTSFTRPFTASFNDSRA